MESKASCCVSCFIQDQCDIRVCPERLNQLLFNFFLLALFLAFLFFLPGLPLESCHKWWATATVACDTVVVIFCCLSSSPYLALIWCLCVLEVLQAPQDFPFPHRWQHEVFDRAGGGRDVQLAQDWHCLLLLRPKIFGLPLLRHMLQRHITHVETLAENQTCTHTSGSQQAITVS